MKKINLTETEKDRIRGLHDSYKNEHGTLIKENPTGARYGHGFKQEVQETELEEMDATKDEMEEMDATKEDMEEMDATKEDMEETEEETEEGYKKDN